MQPASKTTGARNRASRAFTLVELMIVVILIGILTVMAIPTMAEARYNAHTLDDATQIAELYREARTRAMGRGAAMLMKSSATGGTTFPGVSADLGTFTLFEAQVVGTGSGTAAFPLPGGSPLSSCGAPTTDWAAITLAATTTTIDVVNLNKGLEQNAQLWSVLSDGFTATPTVGSLCFTPLGRAYYQASATPVFTPGAGLMHGDIQVAVQRSGTGGPVTGLTRTVIIPDSGSTRIVSK